jgi:hypothetical protein
VPYPISVIAPCRRIATLPGPSSSTVSPNRARDRAAFRCVLVNGAHLKVDSCCIACGRRIGQSYVRHIASRKTFCDFGCYRDFANRQGLDTRAPDWPRRAVPVELG